MKKLIVLALSLTCIAFVSACGTEKEDSLASGVYTLQNVESDVPGDFTITIYEDGTFHCYESPISSYFGRGHYSVENGIVTLKEDEDGSSGDVNYYRIEDDGLSFILEDSANYHLITLEDGAVFERTSDVP